MIAHDIDKWICQNGDTKMKGKPIIAICYDFDGTLSPGNMQEYDFIPKLNLTKDEFWKKVNDDVRLHNADQILVYMKNMLDRAQNAEVKVKRDSFSAYGSTVELNCGVEEWFPRINAFAEKMGFDLEHYILSSGIREMIEGTSIHKYFKKVYASSFWYDHNDVACWPAFALNYTTKTQYLFRINKGYLDESDNSEINKYTPMSKRRIPFQRMIYIGDGLTDIPCMKLVKDLGGHSIAVYQEENHASIEEVREIYRDHRVQFIAPADYSEGKKLELIIQSIIKGYALYEEMRKLKPGRIKRRPPYRQYKDRRDSF